MNPIFEYAPKKIELAITKTGTVSKEQMGTIMKRYFNFPTNPDETDAIALCHFFQVNPILGTKKTTSWADFVRKNPDGVK